MAQPNATHPYEIAVYFEFREIFDRIPSLSELVSVIQPLDMRETVGLLCQMNADFRMTKRGRDAKGKLQSELAGSLLDDETIALLKQRFGSENTAYRPIFHPLQILNVLRLVIQHSRGTDNPMSDTTAKYRVGTACLMMSDLLMTQEERAAVAPGSSENVKQSLMVQALGPFEIQNASPVSHLLYRAQILFHDLLRRTIILDRVKMECEGFDLEEAFARNVGIPLRHWLYLLITFYSYLTQYIGQDGERHPEYLVIDRTRFRGQSRVEQAEIDTVLRLVSSTPQDLKQTLQIERLTDWRCDFVPLKSRPLIELYPDRFFCTDLGLLAEKMHSGVYWAINDGLPSADRPKLFKAWGILFEEYVNSFLSDRRFGQPLMFWPRPKWRDGTESFDGVFAQDSRFMPMEYKGGLLKTEARYSGRIDSLEADLDLKIGEGCRQLARKIETIFRKVSSARKTLRDVPTEHVTRVVPALVVQDPILRGPLINWMLNRTFNQALDREKLRTGVTVEPLNVVGIHELETMAESAEAGAFDIFHGLQLRCHFDPEMRGGLHNFLLNVPGYGEGNSTRRQQSLAEQLDELRKYLFEGL
jgi:hypothetical protein